LRRSLVIEAAAYCARFHDLFVVWAFFYACAD
jgi:hypothetical protein